MKEKDNMKAKRAEGCRKWPRLPSNGRVNVKSGLGVSECRGRGREVEDQYDGIK